jgi:hypothetical protein
MATVTFPSDDILTHLKSCGIATCPCKIYYKNFWSWAKRLPLHDTVPSQTWLWHKLTKNGDGEEFLTWSCVSCEDHSAPSSSQYLVNRASAPTEMRICNLIKHHESPAHRQTVERVFKLLTNWKDCVTAPSANIIKECIEAFKKGQAPTSGFSLRSGRITYEKVQRILWCVDDAVADIRRDLIKRAECSCIMRDERHHRMHLRYSIGVLGEPAVTGFLGQSRDHRPDAIGLSEATVEILKTASTKYNDPPKGALVEPQFDKEAYDKSCKTLEAVSIDSAENEVVSVSDMVELPMFGRIFTLRDLPHGSRRVLSRLYKADKTLEHCFGFFAHWKDSPSQIIQWSDDHRALYAKCTKESSCSATASNFTHMRAAKHRIETMFTPLSRCTLDPDALLGFAQKISILKRDLVSGKSMIAFLTTINGELFLLASMMCEGGGEAMALIRFLDTEGVPVADICSKIEEFLDHITWLFFEGGVFQIQGHTAFIMQWYSSQPHHITVNGKGRAFGGVQFPDEVKQRCLKHMQAWVHLVRHTLMAEVPNFSLVNAFSVFSLPKNPKAAKDLNEENASKLNRLAKTFKAPGLVQQFRQRFFFAIRAYCDSSYRCSYWDAWRKGLNVETCNDLARVICRGETYCPVTSGVEQSFSKVESVLSSHRLNAAAPTERVYVNLLVTRFTPSMLDEVAARAQAIWRLAFGSHSRTHVAPRSDVGVTRGSNDISNSAGSSTGKLTERNFLKRAHADVAQMATRGASNAILEDQPPELWTESHEAEKKFQELKRQKRLVEALPSTSLLFFDP